MAEINKILVYSDASGNPQEALVDSQRRVVVFIDGISQQPSFVIEGTNNAVPQNAETTLAEYTAPIGQTFRLSAITGSGEANGIFKVYVDGVRKLTMRNSAAQPDVYRGYRNPLTVPAGKTVSIKVTHTRPQVQEFSGTVEGYLV
jgi:hypothetical protein